MSEKLTVPGRWYCPKCGFQLFQRTLHAIDMSTSVRDEEGEFCQNCDVALERVTVEMAEREQQDMRRAMS